MFLGRPWKEPINHIAMAYYKHNKEWLCVTKCFGETKKLACERALRWLIKHGYDGYQIKILHQSCKEEVL